MAWFPALLLKHTGAYRMPVRFVYERRRCATKVKMSHALAKKTFCGFPEYKPVPPGCFKICVLVLCRKNLKFH